MMGWLRLDDAFGDHPKVIGLSDRAFRAHVMGLLYCARHLTDSVVPHAAAPKTAAVRELERAGLWTATRGGGWLIHDFLDYNPSKADVLADREQWREQRVAAGKARAAHAQRTAGRFAPAGDQRSTSGPLASSLAASTSPDPTPTPTPKEQVLKASGEARFAEFYERFPRHMKPRDAETAYMAALRRTSHAEIMAGVDRLVADPNLPPKDLIPYPATWLRADGWKNEPYEPRSNGQGPPRDNALAILRGAAAKGGSRGSLPG